MSVPAGKARKQRGREFFVVLTEAMVSTPTAALVALSQALFDCTICSQVLPPVAMLFSVSDGGCDGV